MAISLTTRLAKAFDTVLSASMICEKAQNRTEFLGHKGFLSSGTHQLPAQHVWGGPGGKATWDHLGSVL